MSDYRTHATGGVSTYGAFYLICFGIGLLLKLRYEYDFPYPVITTDFPILLGCFFVAYLGSIFPDVDIKSKAQIMFYRIFAVVDVALIIRKEYELAAITGFFAVTPLLSGHRTWTHSWISMLVIPATFVAVPSIARKSLDLTGLPFAVACLVGYFSHLWMDRELPGMRKKVSVNRMSGNY